MMVVKKNDDFDICLEAIKNNSCLSSNLKDIFNSFILEFLSNEIKNNFIIVREAVKKNELKNNYNLALKAVKNKFLNFYY